MADFIPFITGTPALRLVRRIYQDAEIGRVGLDATERLGALPGRMKLWVDPGFDGLGDLAGRQVESSWYKSFNGIAGFDKIANNGFTTNLETGLVKQFVNGLMNRCAGTHPVWITVPQLPIVTGSGRNKINRALAKATGDWKNTSGFSGKLIFPLIFTHPDQTKGKTERNPKIDQAEYGYTESRADGLWVVDSSVSEETGSMTLRNKRFKALIALHSEINTRIDCNTRIAGPYWGMNLVLWARRLIDFPAIGVGGNFQYYLPGGHSSQAIARLAIAPLRRRVSVAQLGTWLDTAMTNLGTTHPARPELVSLRKNLGVLRSSDAAREQVARFYKSWFELISGAPKAGRSLALFQDLSAAYALGRSLPFFVTEGSARGAESVVEPLMLNCL